MHENISVSVKGKKLLIEIDLNKTGSPSRSGKTTVIASTRGNMPIPGLPDFRLGLNLYKRDNGNT
jgi:hypothetical protein